MPLIFLQTIVDAEPVVTFTLDAEYEPWTTEEVLTHFLIIYFFFNIHHTPNIINLNSTYIVTPWSADTSLDCVREDGTKKQTSSIPGVPKKRNRFEESSQKLFQINKKIIIFL